jgi:hypothetical protein
MKNSKILNGWQNFLSKSEVTEQLAKERAGKCKECEHARHGALTAFIKDELTEIQGSYCNLCKCPLSAKIRSEKEKCPIQKW